MNICLLEEILVSQSLFIVSLESCCLSSLSNWLVYFLIPLLGKIVIFFQKVSGGNWSPLLTLNSQLPFLLTFLENIMKKRGYCWIGQLLRTVASGSYRLWAWPQDHLLLAMFPCLMCSMPQFLYKMEGRHKWVAMKSKWICVWRGFNTLLV